MAMPTFIGIGAQRAATTWVYQCLKEHPQIFVPNLKEIHYFNENYEKGNHWYQEFFGPGEGCQAIGEITPNYLNVPEALERIARDLPSVRLFVILREPISRAFSAYSLLHEKFGHLSFQEACETTNYFLKLSRYSEDLQRVFELFPENQVRIFFYEDVQEQPQELLRDLYRFVGVDDTFQPKAAHQVYNAIIFPGAQKIVANMKLAWLLEAFKKTSLGQWAKGSVLRNQGKGRIPRDGNNKPQSTKGTITSPEYLRHLKDYFRDDILAIQKMTGRDLSGWL